MDMDLLVSELYLWEPSPTKLYGSVISMSSVANQANAANA